MSKLAVREVVEVHNLVHNLAPNAVPEAHPGEHVGGLGLHEHGGARVVREQPGEALRVAVVRVLVRDDDRGEVVQAVQVREGAGVEEDALVGDLDEEAGVAERGELHTPTVCRHPPSARGLGPSGAG